ncbi:amino acid ABC transporter substrate-binding protein [Methanosarcinales archaeon]|nr:MAG: amino acid ABC transporter substrate-binding protein [Methanosarcinales archaeon]
MKYLTVFAVLAIVLASGCVTPSDKEVKIGTLLPLTGDLAAYGGPMEDGARLAIKEVNENGGVLGSDIKLVTTDSQTTGVAAVGAMNQLVTIDKVPAVIGAAGSGVSLAIINIAVSNHVVQISPSNTAPDFETYPDDGFYYRTVPSDALQGKAMAKLASERGYVNASTLVLNNPYGAGFEEVFKGEFEKLGGTVIDRVKYDPNGVTFDSEVDKVSASNPEVIILVGYPDTGSIILKAAYEKSVIDESDWLLSEGMRTDELALKVGKDVEGNYIVANFTGTTPDPRATGPAYEMFAAAYESEYGREPATFSSNTYDAAAIIALAIEKARSADGTAIRDAIPDVANAPGAEVSDIKTALSLIRNGTEINYQGASGEITFDSVGDVFGEYCTWQVTEDGNVTLGESIAIE